MSDDNQAAEEASFESAYSNGATETPAPAVKQPEPQEAKPEPVDPLKEVIARLDKIQGGYDKLTGTVGVINQNYQKLEATLASAKAATKNVPDAPTVTQINNAITNPAKWDELKRQHPEWAEATQEGVEAMIEARLAKEKANTADQAAIDKMVAERVAEETGRARSEMIDSHLDSIVDGDWKEVIGSESFEGWYKAQPGWTPELTSPQTTAAALANPNSETSKYVKENPRSVVALSVSSKITDAAKMLRLYEASKTAETPQETTQKQVSTRQKRVAVAVQPKGAGGHSAGSKTEDDYMQDAYSS